MGTSDFVLEDISHSRIGLLFSRFVNYTSSSIEEEK